MENAEYISQFDLTQPNGAVDTVDMVDDFLRGIKKAVQQSFPNIDKQVLMSSDDFNNLKNYMVRGTDQWDVKNSYITNVKEIDQDNAVQPRSYNDGRYLVKSNNLSDIPDKQAALSQLLTGFSSSSPAYDQMRRLIADIAFPVGTLYTNYVNGANPNAILGIGTWTAYAQGRVIIGAGSTTDTRGESRTFNNSSTGGEYQHKLTTAEMPSHRHGVPLRGSDRSGHAAITSSADNGQPTVIQSNAAGGDAAHNNVQPYITCYIWVRTG